jgi:hypothetical protein
MAPRSEWKWYGYACHFIGGKKCAYHLTTRVGAFLVSTVGDYRPQAQRERLGAGEDSWFETFVFKCDGEADSGDPIIADWSEIDSERYALSIDAERGHYRYCEKYAALTAPQHREGQS